jgi:amidophosphoribosyltransferase
MELIARRVIQEKEGDDVSPEVLQEYADPCSCKYAEMIEEIRKKQNFTSLRYHRLDDLLESIGIEPCKVCTYCFNGKE